MKSNFIQLIFFWSLCLVSFLSGHAQNISFEEVSLNQGVYLNYNYTFLGEGIGFFDFDEDGWDDLTLCQTNGPVILYKNNGGYFEPHFYFFAGAAAIACCWGDLNNDGYNELIISTHDNGIRIFENQNNNNFIDITAQQIIPEQAAKNYAGIALSDINRDGLLDIAVANYNSQGKSIYLLNTGNLIFQPVEGPYPFLDVQKHAFQPAFIDLNFDLWPDLYTIHDFYEGNELFWNQAGSSFSENDTIPGLNIEADAMSNSWNDYDRDGDLDLYVTNRYLGNYFMEQIENMHFLQIADSSGTNAFQWCWSATWMDIENNGYTDLIVTQNSTDIDTDTSGNYVFIQQTNHSFLAEDTSAHFPTNGFCSSVGDFNNDGKNDLAISTRQGYNFELYQNTSNTSSHYIKFRLEGHLSNRNGIGTHYTFWVNNRIHYGYTQSGENYIAQNSQNKIIGIGEYDHIDSLILQWPSGAIDRYFDLPADQLYVFEEMQNPHWWSIDDTILCENTDTLWIEKLPLLNATWWDGTTDSTHSITAPGTYTFTLSAPFGQSKNFTIVIHGELENISSQITQNNCALDSLGSILFWNNQSNEILFQAEHLPDGIYPISINQGDCATDTLIQIDHLSPWHWNFEDTLWQCAGSVFTCPNVNLDSTLSLLSITPETSNTFHTTWQNNAGCIQDTTIIVYVPVPPVITIDIQEVDLAWQCTLEVTGNDPPYSVTGLNWNSNPMNLTEAGTYPFQMVDRWGCVYSDTLIIETTTKLTDLHFQENPWIFNPPYLTGNDQKNIQVYNVLGQAIPAVDMGNYWLLPSDSHPIGVGYESQFYPVRWRYLK